MVYLYGMVIVGILFLIVGLVFFILAILKLLSIVTVPFWSEKKMDSYLFRMWKKESDYQDFEKNIEDGV